MWEDRNLSDLTDADVRLLVESGVGEHLRLEYKRELYGNRDADNKEFLKDICQFANSGGGILLIGIDEQRDANGQPTGLPDPAAQIGINVDNPNLILQAYDARVVSCIEDRLPIELLPIPVDGRFVLAIRVPRSLSAPHCFRYSGHVYFPSRRERQSYDMDIREIKEMVMRTASHLEQAEQKLSTTFGEWVPQNEPYLLIACIPIFGQDFLLNINNPRVVHDLGQFNGFFLQPRYTFNGLERQLRGGEASVVEVRRNGLIYLKKALPIVGGLQVQNFRPIAIDLILRRFVSDCAVIYTNASLNGPFLISMMLHFGMQVQSLYPNVNNEDEPGGAVRPGDYPFPMVQADNLIDVDKVIRPLCDQAHQMFGRNGSPCFNAAGNWTCRQR
jgi:hypothetical protein